MHFGEDYETTLRSRTTSKQFSELGESWSALKRSLGPSSNDFPIRKKEYIQNGQVEDVLRNPPEITGLSPIHEKVEEEDRHKKGKVLYHASTAPSLEDSSDLYCPRSGHNLR